MLERQRSMRSVWISTGIGVSLGLVVLSVSIFQSGEATFLFRGARHLSGLAAYSMGVGYLALAISLLAAVFLGAGIGPTYRLRTARTAGFFCFAFAFALAAALGVRHVLGGSAL
jgi:hypothetical protein